jgi:peroxiredoxin
VGQRAPDFTLKTLDGGMVTLSDLQGKPVLLNFWASWCPPCRAEMPDLVRVYEVRKADNLVVLAINLTYQDTIPDAQAFVKEFKMPFPVLLDATGSVARDQYGLRGLPMSFFVDRHGVIVRRQIGAMTGPQINVFVQEMLQ